MAKQDSQIKNENMNEEIKNGFYEEQDGSLRWYKNGVLHRDNDLPAVIHANFNKEWWFEGKQHRENDLPAIEWSNGHKEWWYNDQIHRVAKPAVEKFNGAKYWCLNGVLHRDGGPAIEYGPHQEWYKHDKRHREDGPAFKTTDNGNNMRYEWWLEGIQYTEEEFNVYLEKKKLKKSLNEELNINNTQSKMKI